jgi:hypothetical protein
VDRDLLRHFARRDWSAVAASKEHSWLALKARRSAADVLAIAEQMRIHARHVQPRWPTHQQRLDDVAVHQRMGEALRAVV